MGLLRKQICLLLVITYVISIFASSAQAAGPTNFANCRLGVGNITNSAVGYDLGQLNLGLYLDWTVRNNPATIGLPPTIEYIRMIRIHQDKVGGWNSAYVNPPQYSVSPSLTTIANIAASQPNALWLIGNEIERRDWSTGHQDEITPELYATAFHQIRAVIKQADPTARIAIAGLVEATPLRLKYLDRVWDSYYNQYGYPMGNDIDVWNVHIFILREIRNKWGADIPAGLEVPDDYLPQEGFLYGANFQTAINAHHDMNYYREFLRNFRAWMAAHGERNKPLLITEYGILINIGGTTPVIQFLTNTFDYMFNATDGAIGYPADENRLVQGWTWYSLNDNFSFQYGTLYNSNKTLTAVGNAWKNYVINPAYPLASQPQRNLRVANLRANPNPATVSPGGTTTVTLKADIANSGNIKTATGNNIVVKFWNGVPGAPGSNLIASRVLADISGCGRFISVEVEWPNRPAGNHAWYVEALPIANETNTGDNIANNVVSVLQGLPQADLAVTKQVNNPTPYAGFPMSYTITVANNGPHPIAAVKVNELLPPGLTFNSYTATQGNYYTSGIWEVGALSNNAQASLVITARVNLGQEGKKITNQVSITSTARIDTVSANNSASVDITPLESQRLSLPIIRKGLP